MLQFLLGMLSVAKAYWPLFAIPAASGILVMLFSNKIDRIVSSPRRERKG